MANQTKSMKVEMKLKVKGVTLTLSFEEIKELKKILCDIVPDEQHITRHEYYHPCQWYPWPFTSCLCGNWSVASVYSNDDTMVYTVNQNTIEHVDGQPILSTN